MTRIRNKTYHKYTTINNDILKDKDLSITERGMLVTLLSLPDNWDFSIAGLRAILPVDGKSKIGSSLKKLEEKGYLVRRQIKDEQGKFMGFEWEIYDEPQAQNPQPENRDTVFPHPEKAMQYKTKKYKTNDDEQTRIIIQKYNASQIPLVYDFANFDILVKKINEINLEKAKQILDFVVLRYQKKEYKNFIPRLDWIFGEGYAETSARLNNKNSNGFCNFVQKQDYDIDEIEKDFSVNC